MRSGATVDPADHASAAGAAGWPGSGVLPLNSGSTSSDVCCVTRAGRLIHHQAIPAITITTPDTTASNLTSSVVMGRAQNPESVRDLVFGMYSNRRPPTGSVARSSDAR